jgi:hypothetical protein
MDYIWSDKEIEKTVKRLRKKFQDSEECISSRDIRSNGKIETSDYRKLMAKLVELGHAFDNEENCESDTYRISVNWKKKEEILAALKASKLFFPPSLLDLPEITDLPPIEAFGKYSSDVERILGRPLNQNDWKIWLECKYDWLTVCEALRGFQTTGELKIVKYDEKFELDKDKKKHLLLIANEIICMYKALECACIHGEIKVKDNDANFVKLEHSEYPIETAVSDLFVDLITDKSWDNFIVRCLHGGSYNPRAETDHIRELIKCHQKIEELLDKPVTDDSHEREVYEHDWKEAAEEVSRADRLLKKNHSDRLLNFVKGISSEDYNPGVFLVNRLRASSIPEVAEAARKWADARVIHGHLKITQKFLRSLSGEKTEERRAESQK